MSPDDAVLGGVVFLESELETTAEELVRRGLSTDSRWTDFFRMVEAAFSTTPTGDPMPGATPGAVMVGELLGDDDSISSSRGLVWRELERDTLGLLLMPPTASGLVRNEVRRDDVGRRRCTRQSRENHEESSPSREKQQRLPRRPKCGWRVAKSDKEPEERGPRGEPELEATRGELLLLESPPISSPPSLIVEKRLGELQQLAITVFHLGMKLSLRAVDDGLVHLQRQQAATEKKPRNLRCSNFT